MYEPGLNTEGDRTGAIQAPRSSATGNVADQSGSQSASEAPTSASSGVGSEISRVPLAIVGVAALAGMYA